jgi:hypothetical protein
MARGFHVKRDNLTGGRPYELVGDKIVLLSNRKVEIPLTPSDDPKTVLEAHERKLWHSPTSTIQIDEFESHSGTYFPAIARPLINSPNPMYNPRAETENELAKTYRRENASIEADIEKCFDVASPSKTNYKTFGTQFEKVIYFACVGVESLFNKILADNNKKVRNARTNTFVQLKSFLRIDEYNLSLPRYPWMPALQPFGNWDANRPSESLGWFDAYNSLKHDKRNNQHKATMENALNSAAAHFVLTYAVFGNQMFHGYIGEPLFFQVSAAPNWQIDEIYFPPPEGVAWQPRMLLI